MKSVSTDENILSYYIKEIKKTPLLSNEDEDNLTQRAQNGDKDAKDLLIKSNLRYVVSIARKYQGHGLPLADLISEGNMGLMTSVERYDCEKGYHFLTYASWWVRQAIQRAVSQQSRVIRIPNREHERLKTISRLESEGKSLQEISEKMGRPIHKLRRLLWLSKTSSLDSFIDDEKENRVGDVIPDERYSPEDITGLERGRLVCKIEEELDSKSVDIIKMNFGFYGKKYTFKQIGEKYGVSGETVRKIGKRAIEKMETIKDKI